MTDDKKKAAIEAEYMPLIRELAANKDPLANLAARIFAIWVQQTSLRIFSRYIIAVCAASMSFPDGISCPYIS